MYREEPMGKTNLGLKLHKQCAKAQQPQPKNIRMPNLSNSGRGGL